MSQDMSGPDSASETAPQILQRYGFKVGSIGCIFESNVEVEVVVNLSICAIPHTVKWMVGVVNLRGNLTPVYDFKLLFSNQETKSKFFLVLGKGKRSVAILIDEPPVNTGDIVKVSDNNDCPISLVNHIISTFEGVDRFWYEFDKDSFFTGLSKKIPV